MGHWCCCFPNAIIEVLENRKTIVKLPLNMTHKRRRTKIDPNSTRCQNTMYYPEVIDNIFSLQIIHRNKTIRNEDRRQMGEKVPHRVNKKARHDCVPLPRLWFIGMCLRSVNLLKVAYEGKSIQPTVVCTSGYAGSLPASKEKLDPRGRSDGRTSGMEMVRRIVCLLRTLENECT